MKIGDRVRFLSEVGGGVVTGFQGKKYCIGRRSGWFRYSDAYTRMCGD